MESKEIMMPLPLRDTQSSAWVKFYIFHTWDFSYTEGTQLLISLISELQVGFLDAEITFMIVPEFCDSTFQAADWLPANWLTLISWRAERFLHLPRETGGNLRLHSVVKLDVWVSHPATRYFSGQTHIHVVIHWMSFLALLSDGQRIQIWLSKPPKIKNSWQGWMWNKNLRFWVNSWLLLNSKVAQDLSRCLETWKCEQNCPVRKSYRNRPRDLVVASQLQHNINWKTLFAQEELMADSNMLFNHAVHSTYCQLLHDYFTHKYIQLNN